MTMTYRCFAALILSLSLVMPVIAADSADISEALEKGRHTSIACRRTGPGKKP